MKKQKAKCPVCDKYFRKKRIDQEFCSAKCRSRNYSERNHEITNKYAYHRLITGKGISFSMKCCVCGKSTGKINPLCPEHWKKYKHLYKREEKIVREDLKRLQKIRKNR